MPDESTTDPVATGSPTSQAPVPDVSRAQERRHASDRRAQPGGGRRAPRRTSTLAYVARALVLVLALTGVIVFTIRHTRPVYATRGTLAQELRKHAPEAAAVLIDSDSTPMQRFLASEKFREEKR